MQEYVACFRDEYMKLFEFVKSKKLHVKNIGNKVSCIIHVSNAELGPLFRCN